MERKQLVRKTPLVPLVPVKFARRVGMPIGAPSSQVAGYAPGCPTFTYASKGLTLMLSEYCVDLPGIKGPDGPDGAAGPSLVNATQVYISNVLTAPENTYGQFTTWATPTLGGPNLLIFVGINQRADSFIGKDLVEQTFVNPSIDDVNPLNTGIAGGHGMLGF